MSASFDARRLVVPGVGVALAVILVLVAAGVPGSVSPSPLPPGPATLRIEATAPASVAPGVARVAQTAMLSALRANRQVARLRATRSARAVTFHVTLSARDAHTATGAIGQIQDDLDPGPLTVAYVAPALTLADARTSIQGDLGRLELLVLPLAALAILGLAGPRAFALTALSGAYGIALSLIVVQVSGGYLLGFGAAAAVALAQAVELTGLFLALVRQQAHLADAPARALRAWIGPAARTTAVRALLPLALLETGFRGAGSIAIACAAGALGSFAGVAIFGGVLSRGMPTATGGTQAAPMRALRGVPRLLAGRLSLLGAALLASIAGCAVLALPVLQAAFTALVTNDGNAIVHGLGEAALLAAIGLGAAMALGRRGRDRWRSAALAPYALAPPAAAIGVLVWVAQDGHLAGALTGSHAAIFGGAAATAIAAVAAVAAGRSVLAAELARSDSGVARVLDATLPAAAASTLVVGAAFATLTGADVVLAQETGLAVAVGVGVDLLLVRVPFLAMLTRWAGG